MQNYTGTSAPINKYIMLCKLRILNLFMRQNLVPPRSPVFMSRRLPFTRSPKLLQLLLSSLPGLPSACVCMRTCVLNAHMLLRMCIFESIYRKYVSFGDYSRQTGFFLSRRAVEWIGDA